MNYKEIIGGNGIKIWLSSDFHLGHKNIVGPKISNWKSGYRNFESINEMDDNIINNINEYIGQDDILIFQGDFSFGGHYKVPEYRKRIVCKNIHVIRGNHDDNIDKYENLFSSIQNYWEGILIDTNGNKHNWIATHYSFRTWRNSHKGSMIHTYGHSHGELENEPIGLSMDVGIDNAYRIFRRYRPFLIDEVVSFMKKRQIKLTNHH